MFPLWAKVLGRPEIIMEGTGLKIHHSVEAYQAAIGSNYNWI
jgi:hypothetical protein